MGTTLPMRTTTTLTSMGAIMPTMGSSIQTQMSIPTQITIIIITITITLTIMFRRDHQSPSTQQTATSL